MGKWEWNSSLETGVELIDEQHHELFARIDQLEVAIYNGTASRELKGIFEYLKSYIIEHLEAEEKILSDCNYPDFERHFEEHEKFRKLISEMSASYKEKGGDNYLAIDVDKQLRKWWENHIMKMDMSYAPFVRKEADYL
jgi:hemerythrin